MQSRHQKQTKKTTNKPISQAITSEIVPNDPPEPRPNRNMGAYKRGQRYPSQLEKDLKISDISIINTTVGTQESEDSESESYTTNETDEELTLTPRRLQENVTLCSTADQDEDETDAPHPAK